MTATATDEARLVIRARDGDPTALADLVRAHHSAAHARGTRGPRPGRRAQGSAVGGAVAIIRQGPAGLGCRYVLDLSEEETALVPAWPKGTVKSRAARALKRLRRSWKAGTTVAERLEDELRALGRDWDREPDDATVAAIAEAATSAPERKRRFGDIGVLAAAAALLTGVTVAETR